MKTLIVIDMQNDFVTGALGSAEAEAIVPKIKQKIDSYLANGDEVIFTRDTHYEDYLETNEGKHLPVPHCIENTNGWNVVSDLDVSDCEHIDKSTFGYTDWEVVEHNKLCWTDRNLTSVEMVGVCTDICVVSNALIIKALFPDADISVDASCCAGTTPEAHRAALTTMKSCQINVTGE